MVTRVASQVTVSGMASVAVESAKYRFLHENVLKAGGKIKRRGEGRDSKHPAAINSLL